MHAGPLHTSQSSLRPHVHKPKADQVNTLCDLACQVVPYVMKFKRHPVSGEPLALKDLVKLNFHRNTDGEFACPVMGKVFTEHTHIVAVKPTGNVYCWDAVEELNIKARSYKDLITDEPFTRKDIIHIQDPLNLMVLDKYTRHGDLYD